MSCWQKASCGTPQTTQPVAKAIACSPQTAGKTLLLETTPTQLTELGEVELVFAWSLPYTG